MAVPIGAGSLPANTGAKSLVARMIASRKIAPIAPEIQIADRMPRGAWRPASTVSSPNVPAVSKP